MEEILFKGKRKDNKQWVEGFYNYIGVICFEDRSCMKMQHLILNMKNEDAESLTFNVVIPETVGQYTGLKDIKDVKIFGWDIVHLTSSDGIDYVALIIFKDGGFCAIDGLPDDYAMRRYDLSRHDLNVEVIENLHDNPNLLEVA
jgi:uncharacterized phage protein (TIGR01671 family)